MERIQSYSSFATIEDFEPTINIDDEGHTDLYLCIAVGGELKKFLVKVDSTTLRSKELDWTKLDSIDITKKIKKNLASKKPTS